MAESATDVLQEAALATDPGGAACLVSWRNVPLGVIRVLTRVPRLRHGSAAAARAQFKPHLGKWYCPLTHVGFHDTKEEAARQLIESVVRRARADGTTSPLLAAALQGDAAEVQRLLDQIRADVQASTEV